MEAQIILNDNAKDKKMIKPQIMLHYRKVKSTRTILTTCSLIAQCVSMNLVFEPSVVRTDFEKAAMNAVSTVLPSSRLHGCRFYLGQSWLRRIQLLQL